MPLLSSTFVLPPALVHCAQQILKGGTHHNEGEGEDQVDPKVGFDLALVHEDC